MKKWLLVIFFILLILFLLIPTFLSSRPGKNFLLSLVNKNISGYLSLKEFNTGWFSPTHLKHVTLKDEEGNEIVSIEGLASDSSLIELLLNFNKSRIKFHNMNMVLQTDEEGHTNIENILSSNPKNLKNPLEPIFLEHVTVDYANSFIARGLARQKNQIGHFKAEGKIEPVLELKIDAENFPVVVFDQVFSNQFKEYSGFLLKLFGSKANIQVNIQNQVGHVSLKTPNVEIIGKGKVEGKTFTLLEPAKGNIQLTPEALALIYPNDTLIQPANISFTLNKLISPDLFKDLSLLSFNAFVDIKDLKFRDRSVDLGRIDASFTERKGKLLYDLKGSGLNFHGEWNVSMKTNCRNCFDILTQNNDFNFVFDSKDVFVKGNGTLKNNDFKGEFDFETPLVKASSFKIKADSIPWNLIKNNQWNKINFVGKSHTNEIIIKDIKINNVTFPWHIQGKENKINLGFSNDQDLKGQITLNKWHKNKEINLSESKILFRIEGHDYPLKGLPLHSQSDWVVLFLKGNANFLFDGIMNSKGVGNMNYHILTPKLEAKGNFEIEDYVKLVADKIPFDLNVSLSKEDVHEASQGKIALEDDLKIKTHVEGFKWLQEKSLIKMQFETNPIKAKVPHSNIPIYIDRLGGSFVSEDISRDFSFTLASNSFDIQGSANLNENTIHMAGNFKDFPTGILSFFFKPDVYSRFYALFGLNINGYIDTNLIQLNGPLKLHLKGERADIFYSGSLQNQTLYLNEPMILSLVMSKEISDEFLDDIVPLFNSAVSSDNPTKIRIEPEGFALPLSDPSPRTIQAPKVSVDLGKVYFSPNGHLAEILDVIKQPTNDIFSVWFTPIYFSLINGNMDLSRVDFLVQEQFPLAIWGKIDFNSQYVDMTVGVTGKSLGTALNILSLPKNYMLTLPLRGPVDHPTLDKTKIITKVASLASLAAGPQGLMYGSLIELLTSSDEDIPPPSTDPLPWNTDTEKTMDLTKPIRDLEKGVKKVFKSLFHK